MKDAQGKWVPLDEFARRKGVSKATVYRRIRRSELIKRLAGGRAEVFVTGEDISFFEDVDAASVSENDVLSMEIDLPDGDDYGIAAQSLRTLLTMHKEVLAEKHRMLEEWESELARREEKLTELKAALAERDEKLTDRAVEARELRSALKKSEGMAGRLDKELAEVRKTLRQFEGLSEGSKRDWKRMEELLEDKGRLIEAKDEVISGMESAVGQKDDSLAASDRAVRELRKALEETRALLKEKEDIIKRLGTEPIDLDGKLAVRDQEIEELRSLVRALENQLDAASKARELTGFDAEAVPTTALIQDQLEYLMTSEDSQKYLDDAEAIPPEEASGDQEGEIEQ